MRRILAGRVGRRRPSGCSADIDPEPAAAASIGQVYRATARDGRALAIKVQYPGIAETVESDMRNLRLLSPLLRQLMPGLEVRPCSMSCANGSSRSATTSSRPRNHRRVERFWRDHPFIRVPAVDTELSHRRVLVTDWIDGQGFDEVTGEPDAVRDRYAEIVYRFFYGTVRELGLALGDPHPGNYLLCADGQVAFFDFGMMRALPSDYLGREARISRAVRESDVAAVLTGLHELGYLPGELDQWDGALLLDYMRQVSWWLRTDEPLRLSPEDLWRSTAGLREEGGGAHVAQLRQMTLPPDALLLRRMEGLLFQTASILRACCALGSAAAELIEGDAPVGELGAAARGLAGPRRG